MADRITPYIGVTGFMTKDEVREVFSVAPPFTKTHLYAAGILMSFKTLNGVMNSHPGRYPLRTDMTEAFGDLEMGVNFIHYHTPIPENLFLDLAAMVGLYTSPSDRGPQLHGFQLNVTWPPVDQLETFRRLTQGRALTLILQVGSDALKVVKHHPKKLIERLRPYTGITERILLDASGGLGKLIDVEEITPHIRAIYDADLNFSIGVAGGLCTETLDIIQPLLEEFPDLSIDAEGRLRNVEDDSLNIPVAQAYLTKALEVCKVEPNDD